ncbi:hypothetical protein [Spiroplasma endosymbiont of Polydrusus pterygomalis]|uniref:hypothetical protein n=1 Tax=Spiroplasma endosymbiont of Polydrusus pterygomalis TaxID=3139327 RepID=UPI003CCB708A
MFSIQALYKGNFEIIFYADNPYTNNEEYYLRLSVWRFRGKTKSVLNNYLRDMTTNYKTSFLLPHDYEIPNFNYPEYVLPPVPYNYKPYTKDIWGANTAQLLKTKITEPAQCTSTWSLLNDGINLFNNNYYNAYYDIEIDLKQIDPTIQSIDKFQDAYKTIEISNMGNLQVECGPPKIENFIHNRKVNLLSGYNSICDGGFGLLSKITLKKEGLSQTYNVNFPNIFTIDTKEITNDIKTLDIFKTNGLPREKYEEYYTPGIKVGNVSFLLQITSLFNKVSNKIKETYLQAYYTNDMKLKIIFSKKIIPFLSGDYINFHQQRIKRFGNDKEIILDVSNPNVLGIRNKSNNPIKITIKPR